MCHYFVCDVAHVNGKGILACLSRVLEWRSWPWIPDNFLADCWSMKTSVVNVEKVSPQLGVNRFISNSERDVLEVLYLNDIKIRILRQRGHLCGIEGMMESCSRFDVGALLSKTRTHQHHREISA